VTLSKWADVDWGKSTSAIAKERGVTVPTASKARRKHAPETLAAYAGRAPGRANRATPANTTAVDDLQKRLKAATARADGLQRELEQARKQFAIARRAFETSHALLTPVLEERDAALAKLAANAAPGTTRRPRSPRTQQALDDALEHHPELARALAGNLTDAWHNPGSASGVDGAHNHP